MKKILLSCFVILTFAIYSFHTRHDDSPAVVKTPAASKSQTQPTANTVRGPAKTAAYKDGSYSGSVADAYYGYIQVLVVISGGRLTDVRFLQYPNDNPNSSSINSQAMPYLKQEALQAQNANVNVISGATDTSQAFVQSLSAALSRAAG